ncbi:vomeronasal type-2 receptor 26-like [Ascaphus truei]|uniref:vomeronasal type-2 receptor 26-like n=1 Tax=Ascaphus truei TaxID=8439 RepID=UPI003F5A1392
MILQKTLDSTFFNSQSRSSLIWGHLGARKIYNFLPSIIIEMKGFAFQVLGSIFFLGVIIFPSYDASVLKSGPGCRARYEEQVWEYSQEGGVIIGGIFTINFIPILASPSFNKFMSRMKCVFVLPRFYRHFRAFIFAIDEINRNPDLLPNITLGYQLFDSCSDEGKAVENVIRIMYGEKEAVPNYDCQRRGKLAGVIGDLTSVTTVAVANVARMYGYTQLHHHMKNIRFTNPVGEEMFFDEDGNAPARYDILNYVISPLQHSGFYKVGSFDGSYPREQQLTLNKSAIRWNKFLKQVPRAVCTDPCIPGFRKTHPEGEPVCCYICVPCSKGEISNASDMEICTPCPEDQWPNEGRDRCFPKVTEFLSFEDVLGELLSFLSLLLSSLTVIVMMLFVRYRDTPIIKANNRDLSFVLLCSLMLSFLCSLLFIGHPVDVTCILRQTSFGIIFTVAVSSVLAKTVMVVIAFTATKPGSRLKKWVGPRISHGIVIVSSFIQVLICVLWLSISPPFQDVNMNSEVGKIIIECNEGSLVAFYSVLGYMGLLAAVSFIVAFLARSLPDSFNEAKYITFSMLVFCSVWVSFIPSYLSTKGKYMVTVEIFAMLASGSGLFGCIFIPKCYVILLKPQQNTKEYLMGRFNANM